MTDWSVIRSMGKSGHPSEAMTENARMAGALQTREALLDAGAELAEERDFAGSA